MNGKKLPPTAYELKEGEKYVPFTYGQTLTEFTIKAAISGILDVQHDKPASLARSCRQRKGQQNACRNHLQPPDSYIVGLCAGIHNLSLLREP